MKTQVTMMLAFVLAINVSAQLKLEGGLYTYQEVIKLEEGKEILQQRAEEWAKTNFVGRDNVVDYSNISKGIVKIESANDAVIDGLPVKLKYEIILEIRNGMYRETVKNIQCTQKGEVFNVEDKKLKGRNKAIDEMNDKIASFTSSLHAALGDKTMYAAKE